MIIETERLTIRPLTPDDADAAFVWLSDPEVNRFMTYSLYTDIEEARRWLETTKSLGFVRRADGVLIGSGDITPQKDRPWLGEIGYNIRRDCWNQGYTTEAVRALIADAWHRWGMRDFAAVHAIENPASGRVMEHCGMVLDHYGEYSRYDGSRTFPAKYCRLKLDRAGQARVFRFVPMTAEHFGEYFHWVYPEPYGFYNSPQAAWDEDFAEYDRSRDQWFSALDEAGRLEGICSFELSGGSMEMGLGLAPALTGQGAGEQFTRSCLALGRGRFDWWDKPVVVRVADFNRRAQKVYERVGFKATSWEKTLAYGMETRFLRMVLEP